MRGSFTCSNCGGPLPEEMVAVSTFQRCADVLVFVLARLVMFLNTEMSPPLNIVKTARHSTGGQKSGGEGNTESQTVKIVETS
jgi:hypothetical protein